MAHMLRIKVRVRPTDTLNPPEGDKLRIRCAHQAVTNHINAVFKVPLRDVWLCAELFTKTREELGVLVVVVILPKRL